MSRETSWWRPALRAVGWACIAVACFWFAAYGAHRLYKVLTQLSKPAHDPPAMTPRPQPYEEPEVVIARMRANFEVYVEYTKILAQQTRVKYLAMVAAGFTEAQALELAKVIP